MVHTPEGGKEELIRERWVVAGQVRSRVLHDTMAESTKMARCTFATFLLLKLQISLPPCDLHVHECRRQPSATHTASSPDSQTESATTSAGACMGGEKCTSTNGGCYKLCQACCSTLNNLIIEQAASRAILWPGGSAQAEGQALRV